MPPRAPPKAHHLHLRTHKVSVFITVSPTTTIAELKEEGLSALKAHAEHIHDIPSVTSVDEFELAKAAKERGRPTGEYTLLEADSTVKANGFSAYDNVFFQFKDSDSGELLPVTVTLPSVDDEDIQSIPEDDIPMSSVAKGKRKAEFDVDEDF